MNIRFSKLRKRPPKLVAEKSQKLFKLFMKQMSRYYPPLGVRIPTPPNRTGSLFSRANNKDSLKLEDTKSLI